ncbi:MAG: sensor histidine kinase [Paracoccaceae bacterium]
MNPEPNSFAVAGSLLSASARQVSTSYELAHLMRDRLHALSAVHRMAVLDPDGATTEGVNFKDLLITIIAPFKGATETHLDIENILIAPSAITPIVLIFYEFCTNALKYGAFGAEDGKVFLRAERQDDRVLVHWQEQCRLDPVSGDLEGFGTRMCDNTVRGALGGAISRRFTADGMSATLDLAASSLTGK